MYLVIWVFPTVFTLVCELFYARYNSNFVFTKSGGLDAYKCQVSTTSKFSMPVIAW